MLTISDLIAVFSLCATFYSLGYMQMFPQQVDTHIVKEQFLM